MRVYTAVVEKDVDTGLYVGYVPGFAGAHSQGETLDELQENLVEVIEMLLEEGKPILHIAYCVLAYSVLHFAYYILRIAYWHIPYYILRK